RLEERVPLPCLLGEVLVKVAQEAGIPRRVGEVVGQRPGVWVNPLEESQQLSGRIAAEPAREIADRVVFAEDVTGRRKLLKSVENSNQVIAVVERGVRAKVKFMLITCPLQPFSWSGDPGRVNQRVVLQEPDEDAGKDPGGRCLGDGIAPPLLESLCGAMGLCRLLELRTQLRSHLGNLGRLAPFEQVGLELLEQLLEVRKECGTMDHR